MVPSRWGTPYWRDGCLRAQTAKNGYPGARLFHDGTRVWVPVAPLVLTAFAGPPGPGQIARHGPHGQAVNWWPENLAWGTYGQNNGQDRERDGTAIHGEQINTAKLTPAIVRECRRRQAAGETHTALAAEYHVTVSAMHRAVTRQTWRHVVLRLRSRPFAWHVRDDPVGQVGDRGGDLVAHVPGRRRVGDPGRGPRFPEDQAGLDRGDHIGIHPAPPRVCQMALDRNRS